MKKNIAFIFLLFWMPCMAQTKNVADSLEQIITAGGIPKGASIKSTMGSDGGIISSPDGKVQLRIPAGALQKTVEISIQPVTNLMPNGNGLAYELKPSGLNFQQPAEIIFHYKDEELNDNSPSLLRIGFQDGQNRWHVMKEWKCDSINKTISTFIFHFSTWVNFTQAKLTPENGIVEINDAIFLKLTAVVSNPAEADNAGTADFLAYKKIDESFILWYVNGVLHGNITEGRMLAKGPDYIGTAQDMPASNVYFAPSKAPQKNPVTVEAAFYTQDLQGKQQRLSVVNHITVVDKGFYFSFFAVSSMDNLEIRDSSACVIAINNQNAKLVSIENNQPFIILPKGSKCQFTYHNLETWTGPVEIRGIKNTFITPATEKNPFTRYDIVFTPSKATMLSYTVFCPKAITQTFPVITLVGLPLTLSIETDGKEIYILWDGKRYKDEFISNEGNDKFIMKVHRIESQKKKNEGDQFFNQDHVKDNTP